MSSSGVTIGSTPKTIIRLDGGKLSITICADGPINLPQTDYKFDFKLTAPSTVGCGGHNLLDFINTYLSALVQQRPFSRFLSCNCVSPHSKLLLLRILNRWKLFIF